MIFSNNTLTAKSYTQYKNNLIEDFQYSKSLDLKTNSFIDQNFMVIDFSKNDEVEVEGVYINAKGKEGKYGDFGNINLNFIEPTTGDDIPF